jgi:hypothetical protein
MHQSANKNVCLKRHTNWRSMTIVALRHPIFVAVKYPATGQEERIF